MKKRKKKSKSPWKRFSSYSRREVSICLYGKQIRIVINKIDDPHFGVFRAKEDRGITFKCYIETGPYELYEEKVKVITAIPFGRKGLKKAFAKLRFQLWMKLDPASQKVHKRLTGQPQGLIEVHFNGKP